MKRNVLAKAAVGLTLEEAENAFARAMVEDGNVLDINDLDFIIRRETSNYQKKRNFRSL